MRRANEVGNEKSKTLQESRRRACLTADRGGGWGAGGGAAALKVVWIFAEIGSDFVQYFQPRHFVIGCDPSALKKLSKKRLK